MRSGLDAHRKGYLFALLASISASFNYIFSKYALRYLEPLTFCIFWFAAGSVYSLMYLLLKTRGRGIRPDGSVARPVAAIGFLSAVSVVATFTAVKLLDPTVAALFARMDVAFVLLIGIALLGERFSIREGLGLATAGIGVLIMNWQSAAVVRAGFLWAMLACVTFAISSAISKHHIKEIKPEALTFYRAFLVTVFLAAYATGMRQIEQLATANTTAVLVTVIGTFFGPFLNHLFIFSSMRFIDVSKCMVIRQGTPVFVAGLSFAVLHMLPTARQAVGGAVIVLGILILILAGRPRESGVESP